MGRSVRVPLSRIHRPPFAVRSFKDPEEIERLANSLREDGQLESVRLRPHPDIEGDYELVFGDCRIDGLNLIGAGEVDAVIEDLDEESVLFAQWAENEFRLPLSEYDRGRWLRHMIEEYGYSQKDLAERIGRPGNAGEQWVSRRLAILRLEGVLSRATVHRMSLRQTQAILNLDATEEELHELGREIEHHVKTHGDLPASTQIQNLYDDVRREFMRRQEMRPVSEVKEELEKADVEPVKDFDDLNRRIDPLRRISSDAEHMIRPPLPERTGLSVVKGRDVRRWCREHPEKLEDIQRAVKYNLLFYAAYDRVIEPEKAAMLQPLPIDDELLGEIAFGLESKKPVRGSGEWNTLRQWNQIKGLDSSTRVPEAVESPELMGPLEASGDQVKSVEEPVGEPRSTSPEQPAEECVREFLEGHEDPDLDLFTWEVAVAYGLSETEARELIGRVQFELYREQPGRRAAVTVCPLCKRHGADTGFIMDQAGDPRLSQLTLEQFVMGSLGGG